MAQMQWKESIEFYFQNLFPFQNYRHTKSSWRKDIQMSDIGTKILIQRDPDIECGKQICLPDIFNNDFRFI